MLINIYLSTLLVKYFFNINLLNFYLNQIFFLLNNFKLFIAKNLNKSIDNSFFEDLERLSFILS